MTTLLNEGTEQFPPNPMLSSMIVRSLSQPDPERGPTLLLDPALLLDPGAMPLPSNIDSFIAFLEAEAQKDGE